MSTERNPGGDPEETRDFLSRWAQRKQAARRGEALPDAPADAAPQAAHCPPAEVQAPAQPPLTEADFADVDFDALDFDADYSRFLANGVPEAIRNRALRKLWASNPVLACLDGLNDYEDNFNAVEFTEPVLTSIYRVGKGFFTDEEVALRDGVADGVPQVAAVAEGVPEVTAVAATGGQVDLEPAETAADAAQPAAPANSDQTA